ncbi:hypothetical protein EOK75_12205 [Pseudorhodobacter turbinis]|uniref:Uncharacterized protein n=1 Tax=Pseudorhodobacter turbinis TaxID=2500533 RepID=A0A4V1E102_9RHOB|nr:hypothetical protein EOK75_12205 [Pseudorhodobacter turbinis]
MAHYDAVLGGRHPLHLYNRWKWWGDMGVFARMMDGLASEAFHTAVRGDTDPGIKTGQKLLHAGHLLDALGKQQRQALNGIAQDRFGIQPHLRDQVPGLIVGTAAKQMPGLMRFHRPTRRRDSLGQCLRALCLAFDQDAVAVEDHQIKALHTMASAN